MRLGLIIGGVAAVLLLFWLIPAVLGAVFSLIWFVIMLPFRLLRLIIVDGIGGLIMFIWRLFRGFFALFGVVGTIVMWLVILTGGAFAVLFLIEIFRSQPKR